MADYEKFASEYSDKVVADAEKERLKRERHQNRFNYYNSIIATLAFVLSVISIVLQILRW